MSDSLLARLSLLNLPSDYQDVISMVTEKVASNSSVQKVILFGSCATGSVHKSSDIDLAVIVSPDIQVNRSFRLKIVSQIEEMLDAKSVCNIPYDILFFNSMDFERNKTVGISVAKEITNEGALLYER